MRLEILQRDEFTCQHCGDDRTTLNVHHRYYLPGHNPWEYPASALLTLCQPCHECETQALAVYAPWLALEIKRAGAMASQMCGLTDALETRSKIFTAAEWCDLVDGIKRLIEEINNQGAGS
jgi:hypothetical protein